MIVAVVWSAVIAVALAFGAAAGRADDRRERLLATIEPPETPFAASGPRFAARAPAPHGAAVSRPRVRA